VSAFSRHSSSALLPSYLVSMPPWKCDISQEIITKVLETLCLLPSGI
jgi:hypothetical protein